MCLRTGDMVRIISGPHKGRVGFAQFFDQSYVSVKNTDFNVIARWDEIERATEHE